MSRQRNRIHPGRTSSFNADNPNEKVKLSEFINGIKQYQDEEYKSMRADFERVEQLLQDNVLNATKGSILETQSLPGESLQLPDLITENQPQFVTEHGHTDVGHNHYRYVKWTLVFFLMLFLGATIKLSLERFAGKGIVTIEEKNLKGKFQFLRSLL